MATRFTITQLRNNLKDLENKYQLIQDDFYLALWLKIMHLDVQKAEAAIRDALLWWKANDVPSILEETFPPALAEKFPNFLDCISKDGLPFSYVCITTMDIHGLFRDNSTADIVRFAMQRTFLVLDIILKANRERYRKLGDEALRTAWGHVVIVDMCGFSRKHIPSMKAINTLIQIAREAVKFPSSARTLYFIGVSKFVLVFLKPIISIINTLDVDIKVYGTDDKSWGADLNKLIDERMLDELRQKSIDLQTAIECNKRS